MENSGAAKGAGGVFVCGSPYTEVSTVAWSLAAHPSFWTSSESRFLFRMFGNRGGTRPCLYDTFLTCADSGAWLEVNRVSYLEFAGAVGAGIAALFDSRAGGRRWVDNSPENSLITDDLLAMFPDCCIVGLLQAPETAVYLEFGENGPGAAGQSRLADIVEMTAHYCSALRRAFDLAPERVMLIEEAELLGAPERCFSELFEFLGEPHDEASAILFARHLLRFGQSADRARQIVSGLSPLGVA